MLSGRGLCDGLLTRPEESYRPWRVVVCDQETSKMRRLKPATGLWKIQPQWVVTPGKQTNKHEVDTLNGTIRIGSKIETHMSRPFILTYCRKTCRLYKILTGEVNRSVKAE